jgi:hypothetical protein
MIIQTLAQNSAGTDTLNTLQEYDEFMESIATLVDLGCGSGEDLEWWATRTTREDNPKPLNISCTGIDLISTPMIARKHKNIVYRQMNFEDPIKPPKKGFDVLWCNNAFQYAVNPLQTLSKWWHMGAENAMLVLLIPQTTNFRQTLPDFVQPSGSYYHYTLVNLIHMLAVTGWDCRAGFFLKSSTDPFIRAVVYKSQHEPMDPRSKMWYDLSDMKLLPESADKCIQAHGELKQQELILPWLDRNLTWYGKR